MARGIIRREVVISIPPGVSQEKVYEAVAEELRVPYAEIRIEKGKLRIVLVGTEAQIRESWYRARNVVSVFWELYRLSRGEEASIDAIVREAGRTFPPEALMYALKIQGYDASYNREMGTFRTNAPLEHVIEVARRIAEAIDEMKYDVKGTAAKRVIAAASVGLGLPIEEVIEVGLKSGVLRRSEDGRIELAEEWRRALRKIVVLASRGTIVLGEVDEPKAREKRG